MMRFVINNQRLVYPLGIFLLFFAIYNLSHQLREETFITEPEELLNNHVDENQYLNDKFHQEKINNIEFIDECLIVIWTSFFGSKAWFTDKAFNLDLEGNNCPNTKCKFSLDRNKVSNADAVLFHGIDFNINDIPHSRSQEQIYIWFDLESPHTHHVKGGSHISPLLKEGGAGSKGFFNWTFTYHSLSDVTVPYGYVVPNQVGPVSKDSRQSSTKTKKLAAWFYSHCNTDSGREIYIRELEKYIPVTKCGVCYHPNHHECPPKGMEGMKYVAKNYHFYLSFENSKCKDYITEKAWFPLKAGVIPVVYGGANYTHYLPPDSFIDAGKLTPEELAQLLQRLANSPSELAKFHEWRAKMDIEVRPTWCPLCTRLQHHKRRKGPPKVIKNLLSWWVNVNDCQHGLSD